jgi:hypothetical protein
MTAQQPTHDTDALAEEWREAPVWIQHANADTPTCDEHDDAVCQRDLEVVVDGTRYELCEGVNLFYCPLCFADDPDQVRAHEEPDTDETRRRLVAFTEPHWHRLKDGMTATREGVTEAWKVTMSSVAAAQGGTIYGDTNGSE